MLLERTWPANHGRQVWAGLLVLSEQYLICTAGASRFCMRNPFETLEKDAKECGATGFSVSLVHQLALDGVEPVSRKSVWEVSRSPTTLRSV